MIFDCIIIGSGQSGLACARVAQSVGLVYTVLEQGPHAGDAWRQRSPELELFTPRSLSALSGLALQGNPNYPPTSAEMADYFQCYQKKFDINCTFDTLVTATQRSADGNWSVTCSNGQQFLAKSIVLANGSNQVPAIPEELSQNLDPDVVQVNGRDHWKVPPQCGAGCLVVGDGASGRQIARDLATQGCEVTLACSGRYVIPNELMQRNIFRWLHLSGLLRADRDTRVAQFLQKRNPVPRRETLSDKALSEMGVTLVGKVLKTTRDGVYFENVQVKYFSHIVWCTGYRESSNFLPLAFAPNERWMISGRGVLPLAGAFVVGRRWLHNRASELIMGAECDARHTMKQLQHWLTSKSAPSHYHRETMPCRPRP